MPTWAHDPLLHLGACLLMLGSCGYPPLANLTDAAAAAGDAGDGVDVATDAAVATFCDPTDPHLMVCYEFEDNAHDGSNHHLDAATANVSFPDGKVGKAMQFGPTSVATVADSAVFDVAAVTIEAWIRPSRLPSMNNLAGIVEVNDQYGLFLEDDGDLFCGLLGGPDLTADAQVQANLWTHVACTFDPVTGSTIYVNGDVVAKRLGGGTLATASTDGLAIAANSPSGSQLDGLIDQVRLMNVARTMTQICTDAGKSSCP
jgi:hypothetical protein